MEMLIGSRRTINESRGILVSFRAVHRIPPGNQRLRESSSLTGCS
jgi:hypothetical protein